MDKYKYIFGKPGRGVHAIRLLDVAAVDYILTIAASILLAWATRTPLVLTTIFMFILGMVAPLVLWSQNICSSVLV